MPDIHESGENYLETILVLRERGVDVRSIDIVHEMELSKPSVSRAMSILRSGGFIEVDKDGYITEEEAAVQQVIDYRTGFVYSTAYILTSQITYRLVFGYWRRLKNGRRGCVQAGTRYKLRIFRQTEKAYKRKARCRRKCVTIWFYITVALN